jgi:hypothetical protein
MFLPQNGKEDYPLLYSISSVVSSILFGITPTLTAEGKVDSFNVIAIEKRRGESL